MHAIVRASQLPPNENGTVKFEGGAYGGEVSVFIVNTAPGNGVDLHKHPYSETWIVRSGRARFTADGQDIEAGPGDIAVVSPETPHKFKNIGVDRLELVCIHASPQIIQEWVKE